MYVVTGASGPLGRLTIEALLESVPADQIVAAVRTPAKVTDLADRGVQVREADYTRPDTLRAAFAGARKVLLISGNEVGQRLAQHENVVDAAQHAGVEFLAYTSALHADTTPLAVAPEHKATEEYIRASGVPFSFLRNGWYTENYLPAVEQARQTGAIHGAAADGRVASATRADYAGAAAAVLVGEGHEGTVHELSGDTAWSLPKLAAVAGEVFGRTVTYQDLPADEYTQSLVAAGLPEPVAAMYAQIDSCIADGWLADTPGILSKLIGRPTTPLAVTLAAHAA